MPSPFLPNPLQPETNADLANLQGDWLTIEAWRAGELFISGCRTPSRCGFWTTPFTREPFESFARANTPQAMMMHVEEGPPKHKGKSAWCLYSLEVGQLHWCPTEPSSNERLTVFPELDDPALFAHALPP